MELPYRRSGRRQIMQLTEDGGLPMPAPAGPSDLSDHYDLTISHPAVDAPQFAAFDRWLSRAAHDLHLSAALIHDGVVRVDRTDANGLAAALAAARNHDRREAYLIQREARPPLLTCDDGGDRPAYWRVLSYLGELTPFWWGSQAAVGHGRPSYQPLTP